MPIILPPSRLEVITRATTYYLLGCAGVLVLVFPPMSIERHLGFLTQFWGVCLIVSFVAALSSLKRRYRMEFTALPLTIVGTLIYAVTVWVIVPGTITRIPQAVILTAMVMMLITRYVTLHRLVNSWKGKGWTGLSQ